jgi:hypothetical protein
MILYDLSLLPAQFRNVRYVESHLRLADRCAPWRCTDRAENPALQVLQYQNVGICSKFPGGASIKVIINLSSALRRVSLMLALNSSLLNKE